MNRSGGNACAVLLALACGSAAQAADPHPVGRATGPIAVDGRLDEPDWTGALALELPFETSPGENTPAPVSTTCRFVYDTAQLYVGCTAVDPDPARVRARYSDRDAAFQDDFIGVVLDTFNDERRAFEFFVNPLGVQMDLVMDDVNGNEDSSWDTIWSSAGEVTEVGYTVEIGIPFSSLRFPPGSGEQTWGLDLLRIYPRDRRVRIGLNRLERDVSCYLCQASKITGFAGAAPGRNLEIVPTFTATRSESVDSFPASALGEADTDYEPGLTARWGFRPSLALQAAVNPDFSQVEADVARLDVNEQFALFFPEKRPFFLEGSDLFDTPLPTVYTRTVADPAWGGKVTGKEGSSAMGSFVARDERTNLLFPGSESSALGAIDEESLAGVVRYRQDVGRSSAVGGLVTARDAGDYQNVVAGVDALVRPTKLDTLRVQALASSTEYPADIAATFNQPTGRFDDTGMTLSYRHDPRNWSARGSWVSLGRDFRADLGFLPQVDFEQLILGGEYRWFGEAGAVFSRIGLGGDWDETTDDAGALIEREIEAYIDLSGPMQSYMNVDLGHRNRVFNGVAFDQSFLNTYGEMSPTDDLYVYLEAHYGDRIDFSFAPSPGVARQGKQLDLIPGLRYNLGRHLRFNLSHAYRTLDLDEGQLFQANLTELRLVYHFGVRAFVRLITQYQSLTFDPTLSSEVPERTLFNQLLFSYKLNQQTALYAGYTDDRADALNGVTAPDLVQTGRTLFFKVGYAWVP